MIEVDYLVVGSGLTGATIARLLADAGREVLVLERRTHVGGYVHDQRHPSGISYHTYGPHYFRTVSDKIWDYVHRFAAFRPFEAAIKTWVDGAWENWPIAASYIRRSIGEAWSPEFRGEPANFEEAALSLMPRPIYEKFVKGYSEKQWGRPAVQLESHLCRRFNVRDDDDPRLTPRAKHQGLPAAGYHDLVKNMLAGIAVRLNVEYSRGSQEFRARKLLVFTGPLDEFFACDLGRLKYRGQRRRHEWLPNSQLLPCVQGNYPSPTVPFIRKIEWKHLLPAAEAATIHGTLLTTETPYTPHDAACYEYPFPDRKNRVLAEQYRGRAAALEGAIVCGRLGDYRYYDMDHAIGRAMAIAENILQGKGTIPIDEPERRAA